MIIQNFKVRCIFSNNFHPLPPHQKKKKHTTIKETEKSGKQNRPTDANKHKLHRTILWHANWGKWLGSTMRTGGLE